MESSFAMDDEPKAKRVCASKEGQTGGNVLCTEGGSEKSGAPKEEKGPENKDDGASESREEVLEADGAPENKGGGASEEEDIEASENKDGEALDEDDNEMSGEEEHASRREPMLMDDFCSGETRQRTLVVVLRTSHDWEGRLSKTRVFVLRTKEAFEQTWANAPKWDDDPVAAALLTMRIKTPDAYDAAWTWVLGLGAEFDAKLLLMCMLQFVPRDNLEDIMSSILYTYIRTNRILVNYKNDPDSWLVYTSVDVATQTKYRKVENSDRVGPFFLALWFVVFGAFPDQTRFPVLVEAGRHLAADDAKAKQLMRTLYAEIPDEEEWNQAPAAELLEEALRGGSTNDSTSVMVDMCFDATVFIGLTPTESLPTEMVLKESEED